MDGRSLLVLSAGLWCALGACKERPTPEQCHDAVETEWRRRGIVSFFSEVEVLAAVEHCVDNASGASVRCVLDGGEPNVCNSGLLYDEGWDNGWWCFQLEHRDRCERSNRECDFYRGVALTAGRRVDSCRAVESAYGIVVGGTHRDPSPSLEACEAVRARTGGAGTCQPLPSP